MSTADNLSTVEHYISAMNIDFELVIKMHKPKNQKLERKFYTSINVTELY